MPHDLKLERMNEVVTALELNKCLHTRMGGPLVTGLSGGERKRASIACELLTNPSVLILDEPTSGLDSAIAYSLMSSLESYSRLSTKTVVATIHQPSSQIFHMFTNLLLMDDGQVAYFGPSSEVIAFYGSIGLHCAPRYNPADFILEQVKAEAKTRQMAIQEAQNLKAKTEVGGVSRVGVWTCSRSLSNSSTHRKAIKNDQNDSLKLTKQSQIESVKLCHYKYFIEQATRDLPNNQQRSLHEVDVDKYIVEGDKFPTGFLSEYSVLTRRGFVQTRSRMLSKLNFGQMFLLAFFTGALWYQTERSEETATDRLALLFILSTYNMFTSMVDTVNGFFDSLDVIWRERAAGRYRLSAYYLSIITTEAPVAFILPTIYDVIIYWMGGLMPTAQHFILHWLLVMLYVATSKSIGLLFAVVITTRHYAFQISQTFRVASFVAGGFYNPNIPEWFAWTKILSYLSYALSSMAKIEFLYGDPLRCRPANTTIFFEDCGYESNTTLYVSGEQFLISQNMYSTAVWVDTLILVAITVFCYISAYVVLRYFRRPKLV